MIIGIGTDILEIARMERALARGGQRFLDRCFTPHEQAKGTARGLAVRAAYFAKRFAAKEACAKAMGSAFTGEFTLRDIGVEEDEAGRPFLVLSGGAAARAGSCVRLHLSLSDERGYALAFVVIETECS